MFEEDKGAPSETPLGKRMVYQKKKIVHAFLMAP